MLGSVTEAHSKGVSSPGFTSPGGARAVRGGDLGGWRLVPCSRSTGVAGQVFSKSQCPERLCWEEVRGGISSPAAARSCGKHLPNGCLRVSGDFGCCIKAVESSDAVGPSQLERRLVDVCDDQKSVCNPSTFPPLLPPWFPAWDDSLTYP